MTDLQAMARSPAVFRERLRIDSDAGPRRLADIIDPWQKTDFEMLDRGWLLAAGHRPPAGAPVFSRAFLERGRGHSKTADLAIAATWLLFSSRRQSLILGAAGDRDQAALLRNSIDKLIRLNPWLNSLLEVQAFKVRNNHTGSELQIISADVATSYGHLADAIIVDEISNWSNEDLWVSLLSTAAKRKSCMLTIITNAGFNRGTGWQWKLRDAARLDASWYFSSMDGPCASWIDQDLLDEQQRLLPPAAFRRLWLNQWTSGAGDALSEEDLTAAVTLDGPMDLPDRALTYVGGLDLSTKRDHSAFTLLACGDNRIALAGCWSWAPGPNGVDLGAVQETVRGIHRRFRLASLCYDPHQAALMIQQLRNSHVHCVEVVFAGKNLSAMASTLLQCFRERRIDLYDHPDLLRDLRKLCIIEKSFGFKLEAPSGPGGHADRAFALAVALPTAMQHAGRPRRGSVITAKTAWRTALMGSQLYL